MALVSGGSAAWFRDYWLSQRQGEDGFYGNVEDDVAALLPDSIDLGIDEEFLSMEAQFEEFIQSSETGNAYRSSFTTIKGGPENDFAAAEAMMKSLSLSNSFKERSPKSLEPAKYWEKPAKSAGPKTSHRRIQQPR
ncbi:hypothetical protein Vadar_000945 [Vaccinium darrowii]|nr:hypothetical protein Vadar_021657 [Vaccinium darrowii]KAH7856283.1 hypothetical protein Vadar_000945 [Vaccinium darrowii]